MTSMVPSRLYHLSSQAYEAPWKRKAKGATGLGYQTPALVNPSGRAAFSEGMIGFPCKFSKFRMVCARVVHDDDSQTGDKEDENEGKEAQPSERSETNYGMSRSDLERLVEDDARFTGFDLATLIRKKYGRSYDVQLIKKEFMGRNLLAMNVMWKYREQQSFPLTEEEYILRLDDVANTLKCWGAVSHIRNSLEKLKERPRIGKAVSIFIDVDENGARSDEWIYK